MLAIVSRASLKSTRFAPATASPSGIPADSVITLLFVPDLALSVGFGPLFPPPKGAFDIAPSMDSQFQPMPTSLSYRLNARTHAFSNTPASVHSRNLRCADELEQMPVPPRAFQ